MKLKDVDLTLRECPVSYAPNVFDQATNLDEIWTSMDWERRPDAPRFERWMNDYDLPYTYGRGDGARTYESNGWNHLCDGIRHILNIAHTASYDCCFVNGYQDGHDSLGWHADDSPEMDHEHPIAVVTFGAEREIWFRRKGQKGETPYGVLLGNGSALLMRAGMQRDWEHRIPKHPEECGPRISLTFRKLVS